MNVDPSVLTAKTSNFALSFVTSIPGTFTPAGIPGTVIPLILGFSVKSLVIAS